MQSGASKRIISRTVSVMAGRIRIKAGKKGVCLMEERTWMELASGKIRTAELLDTNACSRRYGLTLSPEDAQVLMEKRALALRETRRVEFGQGILPKLIYEFCDSDWISQSDYVETLARLQEIFFHYKNEMMDEVTDDELLHFMKEQFETVCFGDLDYLAGTCLELFSKAVHAGYGEHRISDGKGIYSRLDEVPRWDRELYLEALKDLCWR